MSTPTQKAKWIGDQVDNLMVQTLYLQKYTQDQGMPYLVLIRKQLREILTISESIGQPNKSRQVRIAEEVMSYGPREELPL